VCEPTKGFYGTTEGREKRGRKIGIMEEWNDGILGNKGSMLGKVLPIIPRFQHSSIPYPYFFISP
jgi:hypothetical protein